MNSIEQLFENFKKQIMPTSEGKYNFIDRDDILDLIEKECKPFLKHKQPLFRGMSGIHGNVGIKTVRTQRQNSGRGQVFASILNMYLKEKNLPLRSESMFCIADSSPASVELFGDQYYVFPRGQFKHVWFPRIYDINIDDDFHDFIMLLNRSVGTQIEDEILNRINGLRTSSEVFDELKDYLQSNFETDPLDALRSLIKDLEQYETSKFPSDNSKNEIIIKCKDYYYIKASNNDITDEIENRGWFK